MKLMILALFDNVANCQAGPLITERAAAPAIRAFHDALSQQNTMPGRFPSNYDLKCVGTIDDETMELQPQTPVLTVARGQEWLDAQNKVSPIRSEPETAN
jgi:hypothetical protein